MTKPYSEDDLSRQLTEDRTWRIRELSDLRSAIEKSDDIGQRVLLRALVTITYAHWEGYIRFAARKYLEHIALRKYSYEDLDPQFLRNYFLPRLAALHNSRINIRERCELIDNILNSGTKKYSKLNEDLVNTQSNLNFDVFSDICLVCGINRQIFSASENFIDVILLKRRNSIAHGEDTFVALSDADQLIDTAVNLMRNFGDELDNSSVLKKYKVAEKN